MFAWADQALSPTLARDRNHDADSEPHLLNNQVSSSLASVPSKCQSYARSPLSISCPHAGSRDQPCFLWAASLIPLDLVLRSLQELSHAD
jgi:hypothetical protein